MPILKKAYKTYIDNLPTPDCPLLLVKKTAHQSKMDQSSNTNRTMMEHVSL